MYKANHSLYFLWPQMTIVWTPKVWFQGRRITQYGCVEFVYYQHIVWIADPRDPTNMWFQKGTWLLLSFNQNFIFSCIPYLIISLFIHYQFGYLFPLAIIIFGILVFQPPITWSHYNDSDHWTTTIPHPSQIGRKDSCSVHPCSDNRSPAPISSQCETRHRRRGEGCRRTEPVAVQSELPCYTVPSSPPFMKRMLF